MRPHFSYTILILLLFLFAIGLQARSFRVNQIPNGSVFSCANCHVTPGGPRNNFGKLVERQFLTAPGASGNVEWNAFLASLDADNDGVSNGEELQDPYGLWSMGNPNPGNASLVSAPGDASDTPFFKLTLNFNGMSPHLGEKLEIRVIDKATGKEVGREVVSSIPSANFSVDLHVLLAGHSYWVDFYADHNGNGIYDAPPTDHAWRLEANSVTGDVTLDFTHNLNFVDIDWRYLLTVNLLGMSPHVGQLFELRVLDLTDTLEMGRTRVEFIPAADFTVFLPGVQLGHDYQVDFYADLNGNFLNDPPPTDHAWQFYFNSTTGDVVQDFTHNTNFTTVDWDYLFTMNLLEMTPHLGELFELRVVDEATGNEVGRVRIDSVLTSNFTVFVPGIQPGGNYRADFYADHNGNGVYDPPPTDHAWRVQFTDNTGNVVENFTHNTNFTNINWPTAIVLNPLPEIPSRFALSQNYPNPFNPTTSIRFEIPHATHVTLDVYNTLGQRVATLVNQQMAAGTYEVNWDGRNSEGQLLSSGVYIYRMKAGNFQQIRRMLLMK